MPSTYTLISSNVLASSAASVTFSAIPSTYTDLVLRISARSAASATTDSFTIKFNGSSAAEYSYTYISGNAISASSSRDFGNAAGYYGELVNGNTATSNTFSSTEIYIPSYTASQNKPISTFGATETNTATNATYIQALADLWRNTAAITSIAITNGSATAFQIGSSFYLYGISKS
jgi:hypothetical protein